MNKRHLNSVVIILSIIMGMMLLTGESPVIGSDKDELAEDVRTVDLDGAESVDVKIDISVGDLEIRSGSGTLLEAEFHYDSPEWKPEITYEVSVGKGELIISHPEINGNKKSIENKWILKFGTKVSMDFDIDMGVGDGDLHLDNLQIMDLTVDMGTGDHRG